MSSLYTCSPRIHLDVLTGLYDSEGDLSQVKGSHVNLLKLDQRNIEERKRKKEEMVGLFLLG